MNAKVRAFVLASKGDLQGQEMAEIFIKALPAMKRLLTQTPGPFIANVNRKGKVALVKGGKLK